MSSIPASKMPHAFAKPGEFDAETGKIVHLNPPESVVATVTRKPGFGWIAGAAGAVAVAGAVAALFALRGSSRKTPARRRARAATKRAPARRRATAKRKQAA